MRTFKTAFLSLLLPSLLVGCSAHSSTEPTTERGPIGKADAAGSCALADGGDTCGGMSDNGSCWCDDECADFGDCCSDRASVCEGGLDLCDLFVGPCQSDDECGDGFVCAPNPDTCSPSACGCDPATGSIVCTKDCGGLECVPAQEPDQCEDFVGPCHSDDDCGAGFECVADPDTCSASSCFCDPDTGSVACTKDCGGKECLPIEEPDLCEDFVGPCHSDAECGEGLVCAVDPATCSPSSCFCDPDTGSVACTKDCGGKECLPAA